MMAAYVRVGADQNHQCQIQGINRWCSANGYGPQSVRWYMDTVTGSTADRPKFDLLQRHVLDGLVDTVLLWKVDRLSCSLRDGLRLLSDWCDRGLRIVSVTQQIDVSGMLGMKLAAVLQGMAAMEQRTRNERPAAGITFTRERGVCMGRRPGSTRAKPERALELRDDGLQDREIAESMGISRRTVQRYLRIAESQTDG